MAMKKPEIDKRKLLFTDKMLLALILPIAVEQAINLTVGFCDSIMVASVGEAAVSGVSLIDNIYGFLLMVFSAFSMGGSVIAGQYLGRADRDNSKKAAEALARTLLWVSLCVTVLMYVGRPFILNVLYGRIEPDVAKNAQTYLMIVNLSIPFMALYNAAAAIMRTTGDSRRVMLVSGMMGIINLIGNAIGVYVLKAGMAGVAVPTLISRTFGGIVMLWMASRSNAIPVHLKLFDRAPKGMLKSILNIGVPNGVENGLFQLGKILLVTMVSAFGTCAIAANAVAFNFAGIEVIPGFALQIAATTVVARCAGAGEYDQVRYYTVKLLIWTMIANAITSGAVLLALPVLLRAYGLSAETASLTRTLSIVHAAGTCLIWPFGFVLPNVFRAVGDVRYPMAVSIGIMWTVRIIGGYVLANSFGMGVVGVWIAMVADWAVRTVFFVPHYRGGKWMRYRAIKPEGEA